MQVFFLAKSGDACVEISGMKRRLSAKLAVNTGRVLNEDIVTTLQGFAKAITPCINPLLAELSLKK
jgi:hypothetical protein